jgi:hypothetical protein
MASVYALNAAGLEGVEHVILMTSAQRAFQYLGGQDAIDTSGQYFSSF